MQMNPEINLESEIADLERKLAEKKASLGSESANHHDRRVLHEVVGEHFLESGKEKPSTTSSISSDDDEEENKDDSGSVRKPDALKEVSRPSYEDPEVKQKVQDLVALAFSDGIGKAVGNVKATNDPALIDAFHDVLVDELYDHMVREGRIPKLE